MGAAQAADTVDQNVDDLPAEGVTNWDVMEGVHPVTVLRQTFTPTKSSITSVALYLQPEGVAATTGPVFVTVEVKKSGAGTLVGSDIVSVPSGATGAWVTFDFPSAAITAGQVYAIEASVDDDTNDLGWGYSNSAAYAGGTAGLVGDSLLFPKAYDFLFKTYSEDSECGTILFGSAPPASGGFGTFALNCGSTEQLLDASGCPEATAVFFYNKPDGTFVVWVTGSTVAAVNAAFLDLFSGTPDIEDATIFSARCK